MCAQCWIVNFRQPTTAQRNNAKVHQQHKQTFRISTYKVFTRSLPASSISLHPLTAPIGEHFWLTVRAMRNFRFPSSLCVYTVHATRIILAFACGHVFRMSAIYEPIKAILFLSEIIPFKFKCFSLSSWVIFSIFFVCFCSTIRMHIFLVNS